MEMYYFNIDINFDIFGWNELYNPWMLIREKCATHWNSIGRIEYIITNSVENTSLIL